MVSRLTVQLDTWTPPCVSTEGLWREAMSAHITGVSRSQSQIALITESLLESEEITLSSVSKDLRNQHRNTFHYLNQ